MPFQQWLSECRAIISRTLGFSEVMAEKMIQGAGETTVYRAKHSRGLTPQQCIDDELIYWNE